MLSQTVQHIRITVFLKLARYYYYYIIIMIFENFKLTVTDVFALGRQWGRDGRINYLQNGSSRFFTCTLAYTLVNWRRVLSAFVFLLVFLFTAYTANAEQCYYKRRRS